jgi:hypothetical protein
MATGLESWSTTPANNANADSTVNWAEGMTPGAVNDSARAEMASMAKWRNDNRGTITTGGSSTAYTFTSNQGLTLTDGVTITLQMHATNGPSPTLNGDSSGAKPLQSVSGTALPSGTTLLNRIYRFVYRSSPDAWILHGAVNAYTVGGTDVAIADGGTGQSTSTAAFDALAPTTTRGDLVARGASSNGRLAIGAANTVLGTDGTDPIWAKIVAANITDATITAAKLASSAYAAQSDMESASSTTLLVAPGVQHFHPGHPKAGGNLNGSGTPAFASGDYGMGAVTDNGVGNWTLGLDTAFANTNYWVTTFARSNSTGRRAGLSANPSDTKTTSAFQVRADVFDGSAAPIDSTEMGIVFWGDYA